MSIQDGFTMRTFETLGAGKKLITTNKNILNEPFFNSNYIAVTDPEHFDVDLNFINNYTYKWNPEIENYSISNWAKRVVC